MRELAELLLVEAAEALGPVIPRTMGADHRHPDGIHRRHRRLHTTMPVEAADPKPAAATSSRGPPIVGQASIPVLGWALSEVISSAVAQGRAADTGTVATGTGITGGIMVEMAAAVAVILTVAAAATRRDLPPHQPRPAHIHPQVTVEQVEDDGRSKKMLKCSNDHPNARFCDVGTLNSITLFLFFNSIEV